MRYIFTPNYGFSVEDYSNEGFFFLTNEKTKKIALVYTKGHSYLWLKYVQSAQYEDHCLFIEDLFSLFHIALPVLSN